MAPNIPTNSTHDCRDMILG